MKTVAAAFLLVATTLACVSCIQNRQEGDLTVLQGTYVIAGQCYKADYGTLYVSENRADPESRLIRLPLIKIHSASTDPAEPVFRCIGGPGGPNVWTPGTVRQYGLENLPESYLIERHDLVMVGYRGVDGSVSLACSEVEEALAVEKNPLSGENLKNLGEAWNDCFQRLEGSGIDIDGYTIVDVADDMEAARRALGYEKINVYGSSYGTRPAYIYSLRYPESVHRLFMFGVNPPGGFVFEPEMVDAQITYLAGLWKSNPDCVARTPDIVETIRTVLDRLPVEFENVYIDPDKIRIMMNITDSLREPQDIAMLFDAFVAAEQGDYRGLAYLIIYYDLGLPPVLSSGDYPSKMLSADYDPGRDYAADMNRPGSIIGSPVTTLLFAPMKYGGWPIAPVQDEYRTARPSGVETLLLNGIFDMATAKTEQELLPLLQNGKSVVLKELGHCRGLETSQPEAFQNLVETFFLEGAVDASQFEYQPLDFKTDITFQDMYDQYAHPFGG